MLNSKDLVFKKVGTITNPYWICLYKGREIAKAFTLVGVKAQVRTLVHNLHWEV